MFGSKRVPKGCNFVHNDQIWKDHVQRELLNARKLPCKWGFLNDMYMKANGHSLTKPLQYETVGKSYPPSSTEDNTKCFYPLTTTGVVGWRAAYSLERYGRHARGKVRIEKLLRQPQISILHRVVY